MSTEEPTNGFDQLSEQWRERVAEELDPGEEVAWMGSPAPERTAGRPLSTPAQRVGFVTLATAVGWLLFILQIVGPPRPGHPYPWMIFLPALFPVLAFVALAILMPGGITGRRLPHRPDHTLYMVTNRRVVIMEGGRPLKVQSLAPAQLTHMVRRMRPDGSGDLVVTREPGTLSEGWAGSSNWAAYAWREVGLFGLADVRGVERTIREKLLRA
jgi:hypothetical protein